MDEVICITGPTASGKSELAEMVALELDGEIVSADSMQVYRGMDIGTAKVPLSERRVPYHCIDLVDPDEPYSAALFQDDARAAFTSIRGRGKRPVLCGGTGLYIRAALDDMDFASGDQADNPVRTHYEQLAQEMGPVAFHELLAERDPRSAELIHPNNVRRVVRALEMLEEGESYAARKSAFRSISEYIPSIRIGLAVDPGLLNERINHRVEIMVERGLVEEVAGLLDAGFHDALTAQQAIGYKEIVAYLEGTCTLDEAVADIKQATRRYAKRQRTWFRAEKNIRWVDADEGVTEELFTSVLTLLK